MGSSPCTPSRVLVPHHVNLRTTIMPLTTSCVLVIDESEVSRNTVLMLLEHEGYLAVGVSSMAEAHHLLAKFEVDIVLADVGWGSAAASLALCLELKRAGRHKQPRLILLGGLEPSAIDPQGVVLDDALHVPKPLDFRGLGDVLRRCGEKGHGTEGALSL